MRLFFLFLILLSELVAYLLFCKGFFPTKVLLTPDEISSFTTNPPDQYVQPSKQFNRVIFMLVDAMRSDFVFSEDSHMNFTQHLINEGYALGYTAFSNPPTVTLPRLKGITTGSIPNFIDAVLNVADNEDTSTLGNQDSWVKQMFLNGWKINMFGDDTWLKLFPKYFSKSDGTSSFYVSDYTIVDRNVTRHLPEQLSKDGLTHWDCMILHFLGLDHIGHKGGSRSANMPSKQIEIDSVVRDVYESLLSKDNNTLMVLLGDHGMNDAGNHGGSSLGEVSAGMVLISKKFKGLDFDQHNNKSLPLPINDEYRYLNTADQIDLVPTLSELVGLDIPINSLGSFIPSILSLYSEKDQLNVLIKNALQLKVLLDKAQNGPRSLLQDQCDITSVNGLLQFIKKAKHILSQTSSDYNYRDLHLGIAAYAVFTVISVMLFACRYSSHLLTGILDLTFFMLYGLSFVGSSLIEEEHHFWWLSTMILVVYLSYVSAVKGKSKMSSVALLLVALRILKAWNNSGQKYNDSTYIKIGSYISTLPARVGPNVFATILILSFVPLFVMKVKDSFGVKQNFSQIVSFVSLTMMISVLIAIKLLAYFTGTFDMETGTGELQKWCLVFVCWLQVYSHLETFPEINNELYRLFQYVWIATAVCSLGKPLLYKILGQKGGNKGYTKNVFVLFTLLCISQTNYLNVPLYGIMFVIYYEFKNLVPLDAKNFESSNYFAMLTLVLQNMSFFQFGSTNSLASVDLTNSFNGLTEYNVILSGILTFIANWSSPIFWAIVYVTRSLDSLPRKQFSALKWNCLYDRIVFNLSFYSISGLLLMLSCYNLRFHLFIWTVFSPKLLYFLAWLGCNLLIDLGLSAIIIARDMD